MAPQAATASTMLPWNTALSSTTTVMFPSVSIAVSTLSVKTPASMPLLPSSSVALPRANGDQRVLLKYLTGEAQRLTACDLDGVGVAALALGLHPCTREYHPLKSVVAATSLTLHVHHS